MIRGTTAQFKFQIPYDFNDLALVNVVFWQCNNNGPDENRPLPIVKIKEDCSWSAENKEITVVLQPEETARFLDDRKARVQLSATTESGIRFASSQQEITVYPIYNDSLFGDIILPSESNGVIVLDGGVIA